MLSTGKRTTTPANRQQEAAGGDNMLKINGVR